MTDLNSQFARCGAEFTIELLEKLKTSGTKENIIISPFSIQSCMALVFAGAKDDTAIEIATGMKYVSHCPLQVSETFRYVLDQYRDSDLLKIANKLYVQEGKSIKAEYAAITKEQYHAGAESINFGVGAEAVKTINKWVETKTAGKIKDILAADAVNASTCLVLLNALHFKGEWLNKFDEAKTCEDDFWVGEEEAKPVKYMNKRGKFSYGYFNDLKCSALEMPYKDSDLSMFVLLPSERLGLADLLAMLKDVNLVDLADQVHVCEVMVKFPKFKVDYKVELKKVLQEMGICKAFGNDADFSNMLDPAEAVSISQVYHKACIVVNEEGAEAAAATAAVIRKRCAPRRLEFEADHPFLYWIWNKKTILFAGAFVNAPTEI